MTILSKKKVHAKSSEEKQESAHQNTHAQSQLRDGSTESHCWSSLPLDVIDNEKGKKRKICGNSPTRHSKNSKYRERSGVIQNGNSRYRPASLSSSNAGPASSSRVEMRRNSNSSESSADECNSGDEYANSLPHYTNEEWNTRDELFEKEIAKRGLVVKKMKEDGACLFRAVSDQIYGDPEMHDIVRKHCMDYIAANRDYYSQYMTEDFNTYISRKRHNKTHGNHIEIQAMCEMYNRPIEVYCYTEEPVNVFHGPEEAENADEPIRLSYQRGSHYNSIVDPYKATVGVGLGLPNLSPGSADRNLIKDAIRQSEELEIEKTMLEDKLRATDWEATDDAIEEQVARESYLQWYKDNEARNRSSSAAHASGCSANSSFQDTQSIDCKNDGYRKAEENKGDRRSSKSSPKHITEGSTPFLNKDLSPELFGITDWEDADIISKVLATSQEEYLERLKRQQIKDKEEQK